LRVRPGIGIAICPEGGGDAEALIQNADAAMYRAKKVECGYVFHEPRCGHDPSANYLTQLPLQDEGRPDVAGQARQLWQLVSRDQAEEQLPGTVEQWDVQHSARWQRADRSRPRRKS